MFKAPIPISVLSISSESLPDTDLIRINQRSEKISNLDRSGSAENGNSATPAPDGQPAEIASLISIPGSLRRVHKTLGEWRDIFHSDVKARIVAEINKDPTKLPVGEIEKHLMSDA